MPLKALAKDDPELKGEIERFLRQYNQEMVLTRSMTLAARVVEAMWRIYQYPDLRKAMVLEDGRGAGVHDDRGRAEDRERDHGRDEAGRGRRKEEDEEDGKKKYKKKDELSARGVGSIIRSKLQLQVGQRRGKGFPVFWDRSGWRGWRGGTGLR